MKDCEAEASEGGFSLMETLVALVIMAMVSVSVTRAMQTGLFVWQRSGEANQSRQEQIALNRLSGLMRTAINDPENAEGDPITWFIGTDSSVSFVTSIDIANRVGGYNRLTVRISASNICPDNSRLELEWSDPGAADTLVAHDSRVLIDCMDGVAFSYLGRNNDLEHSGWVSSWQAEGNLPTFVRLSWRANGESRAKHIRIAAAPPAFSDVPE